MHGGVHPVHGGRETRKKGTKENHTTMKKSELKHKYFVDLMHPERGVQKFVARPKRRKPKAVAALEANGYCVEKNGSEWNVWHSSRQGETVVFTSLAEMSTDSDPLGVC